MACQAMTEEADIEEGMLDRAWKGQQEEPLHWEASESVSWRHGRGHVAGEWCACVKMMMTWTKTWHQMTKTSSSWQKTSKR